MPLIPDYTHVSATPGQVLKGDSTLWLIGPRASRYAALGLVFLGVETWLVVGEGVYGYRQPWVVVAAVAIGFLALLPRVARPVNALWEFLARPSRRARIFAAIILFVASVATLFITHRLEKSPLRFKYEDEFSYFIQMRMLLAGRLWMPALPMHQYFDAIWLNVSPAYASMYFPGTALMYFPSVLLGPRYYLVPLLASGLCVSLLYLILVDLLDGASALLGAFMLVSFSVFRMLSVMLLSEIPTILLGLTMTFAYLRWRRRPGKGWLILLGATAGWLTITRPVDAVSYALVIGISMFMDLLGRRRDAWVKTILLVVLSAMPFFSIQLIFNKGVTGRWTQTPYDYYVSTHIPGGTIGFHATTRPSSVSDLAIVRAYYSGVSEIINHHQNESLLQVAEDRKPAITVAGFLDPFFWLILPFSLFAMWDRRFWAVWGVHPVFYLLYLPFPFFLWHYVGPMLAPTIFLTLLPIRFLGDCFPRHAAAPRALCATLIIGLCLLRFPQYNRLIHDQRMETPEIDMINSRISKEVKPPAIVLFHFNINREIGGTLHSDNPAIEPAYNQDVLWPEDAPILRAQDLNDDLSLVGRPGDKNRPLYEYYLRQNSPRVFYLYDRGTAREVELRRLGAAADLVAHTNPTTQPAIAP